MSSDPHDPAVIVEANLDLLEKIRDRISSAVIENKADFNAGIQLSLLIIEEEIDKLT